jgi:hypothetical protein
MTAYAIEKNFVEQGWGKWRKADFMQALISTNFAGGLVWNPESAFLPAHAKRAVGNRGSVVGYAVSFPQTTDS